MKKNTIYLDMDGVLADFNLAAKQFLSATTTDLEQAQRNNRWAREQWETLKTNPRFYLTLPKTEFADDLVFVAKLFRDQLNWDLKILTAIPKGNDMPWAFYDKVLWQQQYYPDIPVMFGPYSKDKQSHCNPGDILVDDRWDNCQSWTEKQGRAVRVQNSTAVSDLREIFNQIQIRISA